MLVSDILLVGYRVLETSAGETGIDGGLYGGIVSAGLNRYRTGVEAVRRYEYAPSLITGWQPGKVEGIDISIEYQIPLVLATVIAPSSLNLKKLARISGFYVGAEFIFISYQ